MNYNRIDYHNGINIQQKKQRISARCNMWKLLKFHRRDTQEQKSQIKI